MSFQDTLLYTLVLFAVSIVPGPSMILAFTEGAHRNFLGALPAAFGNSMASLVQALIAFYVFLILKEFPAYIVLAMQVAGALYIGYIGKKFVSLRKSNGLLHKNNNYLEKNNINMFFEGFIIAIFNPKAIIFFISLFPQYVIDISYDISSILLTVLLPVLFVAFSCFMTYSYIGQKSNLVFGEKASFNIVTPILGGFLILVAILGLYEGLKGFSNILYNQELS